MDPNELLASPTPGPAALPASRLAQITRAITLAVLAATIVVAAVFLPLRAWLLVVTETARQAGAWGVAVFGGAYTLFGVLMLPGFLITLCVGFVYGPGLGLLVSWLGSTVAATTGFLVSRQLARGWVARWVGKRVRVAAVDAAIAQGGFKLVLLMRLSPLFPYNILSYAMGLSRVRLRDFVLGSSLGVFPGCALYAYIGSAAANASAVLSGTANTSGPWLRVLHAAGLAATLLATWMVSRAAQRELRRVMAEADPLLTAEPGHPAPPKP